MLKTILKDEGESLICRCISVLDTSENATSTRSKIPGALWTCFSLENLIEVYNGLDRGSFSSFIEFYELIFYMFILFNIFH